MQVGGVAKWDESRTRTPTNSMLLKHKHEYQHQTYLSKYSTFTKHYLKNNQKIPHLHSILTCCLRLVPTSNTVATFDIASRVSPDQLVPQIAIGSNIFGTTGIFYGKRNITQILCNLMDKCVIRVLNNSVCHNPNGPVGHPSLGPKCLVVFLIGFIKIGTHKVDPARPLCHNHSTDPRVFNIFNSPSQWSRTKSSHHSATSPNFWSYYH